MTTIALIMAIIPTVSVYYGFRIYLAALLPAISVVCLMGFFFESHLVVASALLLATMFTWLMALGVPVFAGLGALGRFVPASWIKEKRKRQYLEALERQLSQ
jgi:hypothetical protein